VRRRARRGTPTANRPARAILRLELSKETSRLELFFARPRPRAHQAFQYGGAELVVSVFSVQNVYFQGLEVLHKTNGARRDSRGSSRVVVHLGSVLRLNERVYLPFATAFGSHEKQCHFSTMSTSFAYSAPPRFVTHDRQKTCGQLSQHTMASPPSEQQRHCS